MDSAHRTTLTRFLIEERRHHPNAVGDFNSLLLNVALVCKRIARLAAHGALVGASEQAGAVNVQGEVQQALDVLANDIFLHAHEVGGQVAGMVSEELEAPYPIARHQRGRYLLVFDPLDGSSNVDVNLSVGSIFSVLRAPDDSYDGELERNLHGNPEDELPVDAFLQPGVRQVAAGYAIYGPSTMLVLTVGTGTHGFTLCPNLGEFMLTHPHMQIAPDTQEFAINASNSRFWERPIKRYVDECLAGRSGEREKDFNMRWIASLVAEAHRILMRGGVFMYPRDQRDPARPGRLRLLYEANPIAFIVEQAGGRASTGLMPILQVPPTSIHQRVPLIFGSANEVARLERYHAEPADSHHATPLFAERSLFRAQA